MLGDARRISGPVWSFTTDGGTSPTVSLDKSSLQFGATTTGTTFVSQTGPQAVRLTQNGPGTVTWTATPTQPWIQVTPSSGTGPADLSVSVVAAAGLPLSGSVSGAARLNFTGAATAEATVDVTLNLMDPVRLRAPSGASIRRLTFGRVSPAPSRLRVGRWTISRSRG